jgi:hypothetical protein
MMVFLSVINCDWPEILDMELLGQGFKR